MNSIYDNTALDSEYLQPEFIFNHTVAPAYSFLHYLTTNNFKAIATTFLFFLSLFFLTLICYCAVRMFEIRKKEHHHLEHEIREYAHHQRELEQKKQESENVSKNERWLKTLHYLFSQHASDWKLSIIEADAMLEVLMSELGFKGESLGDRLKSANQESFRNLSSAWEVHTIRNRIAHEGAGFELSQREAKRIVAIYEKIFREYGYI